MTLAIGWSPSSGNVPAHSGKEAAHCVSRASGYGTLVVRPVATRVVKTAFQAALSPIGSDIAT